MSTSALMNQFPTCVSGFSATVIECPQHPEFVGKTITPAWRTFDNFKERRGVWVYGDLKYSDSVYVSIEDLGPIKYKVED